MTERAKPVCCGCRREINVAMYRDALGDVWHELCWQRQANIYYDEQVGDAIESGGTLTALNIHKGT